MGVARAKHLAKSVRDAQESSHSGGGASRATTLEIMIGNTSQCPPSCSSNCVLTGAKTTPVCVITPAALRFPSRLCTGRGTGSCSDVHERALLRCAAHPTRIPGCGRARARIPHLWRVFKEDDVGDEVAPLRHLYEQLNVCVHRGEGAPGVRRSKKGSKCTLLCDMLGLSALCTGSKYTT